MPKDIGCSHWRGCCSRCAQGQWSLSASYGMIELLRSRNSGSRASAVITSLDVTAKPSWLFTSRNHRSAGCRPQLAEANSQKPQVQAKMVLSSDIDLLHPPREVEQSKHKLKRLVQSPNSYFMDVKCQGCFNITTVFSHSQTVVTCTNCSTILCTPTGGKARLTEGCSFRRKGD